MSKRSRLSKNGAKPRASRMKPAGLQEFIDTANFEIHTLGGKVISVGLPWGESKRLAILGITRNKQIEYLDYLQDHPSESRMLL